MMTVLSNELSFSGTISEQYHRSGWIDTKGFTSLHYIVKSSGSIEFFILWSMDANTTDIRQGVDATILNPLRNGSFIVRAKYAKLEIQNVDYPTSVDVKAQVILFHS